VALPGILCRPSPNHSARRNGLKPRLVVLHHTRMLSAEAALERLCDPAHEVSAHYLITATGEILQLVPESERAWHAGAGEWHGQQDINSRSIGIELDNAGDHPFSEPLMDALERLLADILERHGMAADSVIGHSDMAPGRKCDPGARFDWGRLARRGLAVPAGRANPSRQVTEEGFVAAARTAGYTADVPFETLLHSTRLRFAPWREGPLCAADFALGQGTDTKAD
jgi:N-acetylmuramoyl-L-alanine amidase